MDRKFRRRIYRSWSPLWQDIKRAKENRDSLRSGLVSYAFRERLMLTVTEVNGCRYCSYFHAKEALKAGLSEEETRRYLQGDLKSAPADELPALLYAQHWADHDAKPDQSLRQNLFQTYGNEKAEAIETVLTMIRMGNLLGNLGDYLLYKLSFGRRGLTEDEIVV
jgi:AhpD family alkylhydroperoxidase